LNFPATGPVGNVTHSGCCYPHLWHAVADDHRFFPCGQVRRGLALLQEAVAK